MKSMVKLLIPAVVLTLTFSAPSNAQTKKKKDLTKNVPAAVLESFKKAYPNAVIKGSGKENEEGKIFYEIESVDGKVKRDLLFQPDGKIAEIEEKIPESSLPDAVKQSIRKEAPKGKITTAERLTKDGTESYEIVVKEGKNSTEIALDKDGKVTKTEKMGTKKEKGKEEEDDED